MSWWRRAAATFTSSIPVLSRAVRRAPLSLPSAAAATLATTAAAATAFPYVSPTSAHLAHADSSATPPASSGSPSPVPHPPNKPHAPISRYAVADAVEHVLPAVVNIRRMTTPPSLRSFFTSNPSTPMEVSCGSGFILSSDGLIVTNAHVVQPLQHLTSPTTIDVDNDDHHAVLHVTLASGETYVARVVAADHATDIALVRINADRPLPVASFGASSSVRLGEFVAAVGSPLALANSVSFGIVSTLARDLSPAPAPGLTYLQLDVAINEGSSGGPVVALDGQVVGICSMKIAGGAEGIAFAIPSDFAQRAVADLLAHGYVRRPFVGLTLISVTPDLFEDIRQDVGYRPPRWLETEIRRTNCAKSVGLMVHDVAPDAPGAKAGLKPGDVVIAVNDVPTTTTSEFLAVLSAHVEEECVLRVRRGASGRTDEVTIRPDVLPPDHTRT